MRKKKTFHKHAAGGGEIITGIIEKHSKGFGFVRQEEGGDIFIARSNMLGAMNGDLVEADLLPPYLWTRSKEGIVTKILQRNTVEIVGTFQKNKKFGFVVADDKKMQDDIFIKKDFFRSAQNGDKVVAKITQYPDKVHSAEGKITEIIARNGQTGSDVLSMKPFRAAVMQRQKPVQKRKSPKKFLRAESISEIKT